MKTFFGHPPGLATLFLTEVWERFSYYGMRALLILFMTAGATQGGLGFDVATAAAIYGLYTSAVYLAGLPGGWIADQVLGQRKAVLWGGVLIALGQFSLATPRIELFYAGLALIIAGTGLLKPNISTIVGQLYEPGDPRRDSGFSIFYMGINIGAFVAPLACGYVGERVDWHLGFGLAGAGMTLGVIQYTLGQHRLGEAGLRPSGDGRRQLRRLGLGLAAAMIVISGLALSGTATITAAGVARVVGALFVPGVLILFGWLFFGGSWTPVERRRLFVVGVLFLASTLFWSVFEQAGSTLNLFAQRSTRTSIAGFSFPSSWFQSVNGLFIIVLAPVMAWLWIRLGKAEPSSPAKFALGLLFAGLGFVLLVTPAQAAASGLKVSPLWLTGTYMLHTVGELCLSPVGLSATTKLAPPRVAGFMMGVWFLSLSTGNFLGGQVASLYESLALPTLFGAVGGMAVAAALLLALFVRPIRELMGGIK